MIPAACFEVGRGFTCGSPSGCADSVPADSAGFAAVPDFYSDCFRVPS